MPNLVSLSAEQGPQNVDVEQILGAAPSTSPHNVTAQFYAIHD